MRILWMRKTGWLLDVNAKIRSPVLESVAEVDMPDNDAVMAKIRSDCEEYSDVVNSNDRRIRLIVVESELLSETLYHQPRLVSLNIALRVSFDGEHPPRSEDMLVGRSRAQLPDTIFVNAV